MRGNRTPERTDGFYSLECGLVPSDRLSRLEIPAPYIEKPRSMAGLKPVLCAETISGLIRVSDIMRSSDMRYLLETAAFASIIFIVWQVGIHYGFWL